MATSMPAAECRNDDCEHGWNLTKPPEDYARGWPTCPECGSTKVLVNDMTREEAEDRAQKAQESQQARGRPQGQQIQPAEQPDGQAEQAQIQAEEDAAAMQAGGEQLVGTIAPAFDDGASVQDRTDGVMRGAQLAGGIISGLMKYNEQKRQQQEQNARGASLQEVSDKPQCGCGFTFSRIPEGAERVQCQNCGAEYEVV